MDNFKLRHSFERYFYLSILISLLVVYTAQSASASFSVSSTDPADETTNVGRKPTFNIVFPNNVCTYMTNVYLKLASNGATVDTFTYADWTGLNSPNISVTVHGPVTLQSNTAYYLDVTTSAFYDCLSVMNLSNSYRLDFTTGTCTSNGICFCYNPPRCIGPCFGNDKTISHLSPPDNGHFMQSYEGLNIVFNGDVTVGTGNITIHKYSDDSTVETIDVTSGQVTGWGTPSITINPSVNLLDNTQYYIDLDMQGYSGTENKTKWNFYTKSTPNSMSGSGL